MCAMAHRIPRRPSARAERAAWYASVLAQQERSGLSVAEFADEVGVAAVTLYAWKRRLSSSPLREESSRRRGLVEVRVCGDAGTSGATRAAPVVRLGTDRAIEVPPGFDACALMRLVLALEAC